MANTGSVPSLLSLLSQEYQTALQTSKALQARQSQLGALACFLEFSENYLDANPATETWYPGKGVGFLLANTRRATLCRAAEVVLGTMQDSASVAIMEGKQTNVGDGAVGL